LSSGVHISVVSKALTAIIETPIADPSGPAAVVDPDELHLAEPVMDHTDTEFRLRLYVKPLLEEDPIEGQSPSARRPGERMRDTTKVPTGRLSPVAESADQQAPALRPPYE
jgi:hypothetical protein